MKKVKVSKSMAKRIGVPEGDIIEYDALYEEHELSPTQRNRNVRLAKNVYWKGKRVGGTVDIDD